MLMYLVMLGLEFVVPVDTLTQGMSLAVDAFKNGWETDIINPFTGEIMVSLRDGETPYFSTAIHEVLQRKGLPIHLGGPFSLALGRIFCQQV